MLHSFVVAKLLPRLPTVSYAPSQHVAASLVTKPFLALHIQLRPTRTEFLLYRSSNLFVVTREKPSSPESQFFVLNSGSNSDSEPVNDSSLTVTPTLPFEGPLYLLITPRILAAFPDTQEYERISNAERYQLDEASVDKFLNALKEAGPSAPMPRITGGDDEPSPEWDTWSGETPHRHFVQFSFDLLPFDNLPNDFETRVFDELPLLRQLTLDYTWEGCELIIEYIESMREFLQDMPRQAASGRILRPLGLSSIQEPSLDLLAGTLRPCTAHLQSLPVVHDGNPIVDKDKCRWADDWRDDVPELELYLAEFIPAVMAKDIEVILLDCNILIDRDGPLQEALVKIFPPSKHLFSVKELLDLYVEYETLRAQEGQPLSAIDIIRSVARYLGVSLEDPSIDNIVDIYTKPRLSPEAQKMIQYLIKANYKPVAVPSTVPLEAVLPINGLLLELFAIAAQKPPLSWDTVLSFCKQINPTIRPDQILVMTSDLYGICEPASQAGLPTAFLKVAGSRSAKLSIPTIVPTYILAGLADLLPLLRDPASVPAPSNFVLDERSSPQYRIRNAYQCTFLLGVGSFANVWNGIQVHTGAEVAIKFELMNHPDDPPTLPYEAAIYAQLEGVQGIPRIHWSGQDINANVLIMDKLGPNLEQLRRFCRNRFGLKTVLMLGEQMLSTIEQVHGRGVIVRDIKPQNFALGLMEEYQHLYLFDMGLSKLYLDPSTGEHMPFREGRGGIGTPRYISHNVHFGLEPSRRDDIESIGILLLYLLHGRLPWQGIVAPDIPAKLRRIGEMKRGKPFKDLLAQSPAVFTLFFDHCRSLEFKDKLDYAYLRGLLRGTMEEHRWEYDWQYDWWKPGDQGTLLADECKLDMRFVEPLSFTLDQL